jgi:hypothetical protein
LKCFKVYFISLKTFQSLQGCSIAVIHDGYVVALVGLKCFKEKNNNNKFFLILFYQFFFPCCTGSTHGRRGRRLCCSLSGIKMLQGIFLFFYFYFFQIFFHVMRDPCIAVVPDDCAAASVGLKCFKIKNKKNKK